MYRTIASSLNIKSLDLVKEAEVNDDEEESEEGEEASEKKESMNDEF